MLSDFGIGIGIWSLACTIEPFEVVIVLVGWIDGIFHLQFSKVININKLGHQVLANDFDDLLESECTLRLRILSFHSHIENS